MNNKVKFLRGTATEYENVTKDSDTIYFTTDDGKLYIGDKEVSGGGSSELPIATTEILGGVMPDGTTINVDENGVITAISAEKLNTSAGSSTKPIYFSGGKPVACSYTLGRSVPSNAVFTDTVYTLPKATTSVLGGVKVDGTTIAVDSNGVISTTGGLTVDTLLDITVSKGSTSNSYSSCNPAEGSIITLTGNMTDYKLLQFIEVNDSGISPTRAPITIDLSIVGWDSYINRTLALGSVYGVLQYYYVSPNQIKLSYLINQNSNSGRLLIVGIK